MAQLTLERLALEGNRIEAKLKRSKKKTTLKNVTKIWVDAGFGWKQNLGQSTRKGRVAYKIGRGKFHIEPMEVPVIDGLLQYSNIFELLAIRVALEKTRAKRVLVITDSKIAMAWVKRRRNDLGQFSKIHFETKARIDKAKQKFESFHIRWVPRSQNVVGCWLESNFK